MTHAFLHGSLADTPIGTFGRWTEKNVTRRLVMASPTVTPIADPGGLLDPRPIGAAAGSIASAGAGSFFGGLFKNPGGAAVVIGAAVLAAVVVLK